MSRRRRRRERNPRQGKHRRAEKLRQPVAGRMPGRLERAHEKIHRLIVELLEQITPDFAHALWLRPKGTVVQINGVRADLPLGFQRRPSGIVIGREICGHRNAFPAFSFVTSLKVLDRIVGR